LIIKGTVEDFPVEEWISNTKFFSFTFITVLNYWVSRKFFQTGEFLNDHRQIIKERFGEVKQALIGLDDDIHIFQYVTPTLYFLVFFRHNK